MPTFEIESGGKAFQIEAPDQAAAIAAIQQFTQAPSTASLPEDVAKSFGSGVVRGGAMLAGTGGDVNKLMAAGIQKAEGAGVPVDDIRQKYLDAMPGFMRRVHEQPAPQVGSSEIMGAVDRTTGLPVTSYQPQTTAGKYARTVGEFTPTAMMGGGGLMRGAIGAGLGSEAAGQAAEGTAFETPARVLGAMGGSVVPSAARRAVTPLPVDAERARLVQVLRNEGVNDITAGQATGRKRLQYFEAERGAGPALAESAGEQFTAAALRRAGENANRATPEVIDRAFTRIGNQFDTLAARNNAVLDQQFGQSLQTAVDDYFNLVAQPNRTPAVTNFAQEIQSAATRHGGALPGDVYQSLRSRMERVARGMGNNPEARHAIRDMREALDDAMERSIAASGNQADLGAWQEARNQYRNMLAIERAATAGGENAALGLISPAQLRMAAVNQGRRAYARGQGDFADLARAGVGIMTPLPNSGTPGRTLAQNMGTGTSALVGALLGGGADAALGTGGMSAAAGALAGTALPSVVGRAVTSPLGRQYLANQLMPGLNAPDPRRAALINALVASDHELRNRLGQITAP